MVFISGAEATLLDSSIAGQETQVPGAFALSVKLARTMRTRIIDVVPQSRNPCGGCLKRTLRLVEESHPKGAD